MGELTRSLSPTRIGSATMLATEILARSGTEPIAPISLGSVGVWFERHHAKWSQARQQTITKPFEAVYPGAGAYRYTTKSHLLFDRFLWPDHVHSIEYQCEPQGGFVSHLHTPERSGLRWAARGKV